ncbi:MAG TPA: restriction endonuclease [Candidatus Omnitrophica bacterium]|nr:restriction endonuclease [Candidatus Omnitrophota bacterium]
MLSDELFNKVLVDPVNAGANELFVVSGYATSAMAFHHLEILRTELKKDVKIHLIVGMCILDGLSQSNHMGFMKIMENDFKGSFTCSYVTTTPPLHSKIYAWYQGKKPIAGFAGSANYTQAAFYNKQRECVIPTDPIECRKYFDSLGKETMFCNHNDVEATIQIYPDDAFSLYKRPSKVTEGLEMPSSKKKIAGVPTLTLSLLTQKGAIHNRAGLNWGQRPKRNRDQAYIPIATETYKDSPDFFPARGLHFTVHTDDDKTLICTRAQDNGKAIEIPQDNSLLGQYFKSRMGLPQGKFITKEDLVRYGRTDVEFYKIDDETYYMDFSIPA